MLKRIGFALALIITFAGMPGCVKTPECDYDECAYKVPDNQIQNVQNYLTSQGITGAVQHCSGMFYIIDNPGTGDRPDACNNVTARYEDRLTNGTLFDDNSGNPAAFSLRGVVSGWRNGIPLIKEGGRIRLFIPPALGYGTADYGPIPGNSILVFNVELISVD